MDERDEKRLTLVKAIKEKYAKCEDYNSEFFELCNSLRPIIVKAYTDIDEEDIKYLDYEDALCCGDNTIHECAINYDDAKGIEFSTYVYATFTNELKRNARKEKSPVLLKFPAKIRNNAGKVRFIFSKILEDKRDKYAEARDKDVTPEEIQEELFKTFKVCLTIDEIKECQNFNRYIEEDIDKKDNTPITSVLSY